MQSRRQFLRSTATGAAAAVLSGSLLSSCAKKRQPNVLMIIVDDMNDYGFYDALPGVKIPRLRKFKQSALTFRRAYCASPACVPSRAAVFSGLFPHHTGVYLNGNKTSTPPWKSEVLLKTEALPECFKRNGYSVWGRGKILHSLPEKERHEAMWDNDAWGGGFGPFADEDHQVPGYGGFWGVQAFDDQEFPDVKNADKAIEYLQEEHENPFFMVYGLWRPHTPFTCPQRFYDLYDPAEIPIPLPTWREDDMEDVPEFGHVLARVWGERFDVCGNSDPEMWRKFVHAYYACTTFADWNFGRVIEALDNSPYADDTIVVFWSDNGYHCGEKNHWEKTTLWEQATLAPMAIRVPGMKTAGDVCMRPVNSLDIYPTLVELCGIEGPAHTLDGLSLRPYMKDPNAGRERPAITTYGEGNYSARDERYRYIRYHDGTEELYDHDHDPHEFDNIADDPELADVKKRLSQWIPETWVRSIGGRLG